MNSRKTIIIALACAALGTLPRGGHAATDTKPDLQWADTQGAPECHFDGDENPSSKFGGFYDLFWTNGQLPYDFVSGSNTPVRTVTLTDVSFVIPFDGAELNSPTGFPMNFQVFDVVRVQGSQLNDGRDLIITSTIANAGNTAWQTLKVDLLPNSTFWAESPTGASVNVFTTETVSAQNQARFEDALTDWEDAANVSFAPRNGEAAYIRVKNATRNRVANVGMNPANAANDLLMDAWASRSVIVHEVGHMLGAKHEQQRPDRNTYVSVDTTKVTNGFEGNFTIDTNIIVYPNTIYDFGSIMHYGQNNFLAQGQTGPVITVLQPWTAQWQTVIGTSNDLSFWDAKTMSFMYPENNWRFLDKNTSATTNNGGFLTPYDDFDQAYAAVPSGGRMIVLDPGSYVEPGVYSKSMVIEAPQGGVLLKAQ